MRGSKKSLTGQLIFATVVACLGSIQFGYHIAELNAPQQSMVCSKLHITGNDLDYDNTLLGSWGLRKCVDISDQQFGLVTSIFSIGGLIGSFFISSVANKYGRKYSSLWVSLIGIFGSMVLFLGNSYTQLLAGRLLVGIACGSSIVITPLYINEIAPVEMRGLLGSMNQLSINLGILLTQSFAIKFANEFQWRWILLVGSLLALINLIGWWKIYESPKWLVLHLDDTAAAEVALFHLRQGKYKDIKDEIQLWKKQEQEHSGDDFGIKKEPSFWEYVTSPELEKPRNVITAILVGQQFGGINSIIFYGVKVISTLLPDQAILINFAISIINVVVTLYASVVIEKFGRRPLLLASTSIMSIMTLLISICMIQLYPAMLVVSIFIYIASFALGLGPIPFLIIGELSSPDTSAIAQSYGTVCNWIATFFIGYTFPIFNEIMGGYVYLIFSVFLCMFTLYVFKRVPETKSKINYKDVWQGY